MQKTIFSIYYSALQEIRRPLYQGVFAIPVVKKGESPAALVIKDHHEFNDQPFFTGTNNNRPYKMRITILGEQIAEDILLHWTKLHPEMTTSCAPGLWVGRDIIFLWDDDTGKPLIDAEGKQEYRPATKEERDAMFAEDLYAAHSRQDAWCEAALRKGDIMSEDVKKVPWIPQYCLDSVDYSGRERAWRHGLRQGDIKKCPFCTKAIASMAFKCPFCAEVVDAEGYAEFKARQENAQRSATERIQGEVAQGGQSPPLTAVQLAARKVREMTEQKAQPVGASK